MTCLVTLFDRKLQVFTNSRKLAIFVIFDKLLSTQNVNVARFARYVESDFGDDFPTLCVIWKMAAPLHFAGGHNPRFILHNR